MVVKVKMEGVEDLERALSAKLEEYREQISQAVGQVAEDIADDWRSEVPVDEGDYRDSIGVQHDGLIAEIANYERKGRHGVHVEFGTSRMAARPAAQPAAERGRAKLEQGLRDAIK